jgi:DNA-binding PadR family transcriptional regulator
MHGYQLKKRLSETLGPFWQVSYGSLYPALKRLQKQGTVEMVFPREDVGRRKNVYRLTEQGERIFAELLEQRIPELRTFRPTGVVNEFQRATTREMDHEREARNTENYAAGTAKLSSGLMPLNPEMLRIRTSLFLSHVGFNPYS